MEWLEVSVTTDAEVSEAVADVLSRFAPGGVAVEVQGQEGAALASVVVKAYLPVGPGTARVQAQLEEALWHLGQISPIPAPTFARVAEADWADAWKEHYAPLRVGERIVIKPTWREFEARPDDVIIEIDPGMAFGTGLHPTTRMCLLAIEAHVRPGMRVLDLGTGSGILALAAAKLGAREVLALDNDPVAVAAARENVERNAAEDKITVGLGSIEQANDTYDLVVVNILAKVIIELVQQGLAARVRPGGTWLAAGMIEPQVAEVVAALLSTDLRVETQQQIADWVTLIGLRSNGG